MVIQEPTEAQIQALLSPIESNRWKELVGRINEKYDVDQIWSKGFGDWVYEYKFRRGGKTLCALYMKKDSASVLITLGRVEREKFEAERQMYSNSMNTLYDNTKTLHDGKWLWIPIETGYDWNDISLLLGIKRKPNR